MRLALRLGMVVVCLLVAAAVLGRPAAAVAQSWQAAYEAGDYQSAARLLHPVVIADDVNPSDPAPSKALATMYARGLGVEHDQVLACGLAQQSAFATSRLAGRYANDIFRYQRLEKEAERFTDEMCGGLSHSQHVAAANSVGCYKFGLSAQVLTVGPHTVRIDREGFALAGGTAEQVFEWECVQGVAGFRAFEVQPPRDRLPGVGPRYFLESLTWRLGGRPGMPPARHLQWTLLEVTARGVGAVGGERLPWLGEWPGPTHSFELAPTLSLQMIRTGHVRWRIEGTPPSRGWIMRPAENEHSSLWPPCEAAWAADSIFTGTVRQIEAVSTPANHGGVFESTLVTLDVERGFLNAAPGVVQVRTNLGSCGRYDFAVGRRYLVYAQTFDFADLPIVTNRLRTRPIENAADDLRYLTRLPDPAAGARVFGRVTGWLRAAVDEQPIDNGPVEGLTVQVRGAGFHREATTDRNGVYEITGLPVGQATVSIEAPQGVDRRYLQREVTLRDPRGCSQQNFELVYSAIVAGRVVDAGGRPIRGAQVDAVDFELAGHSPPPYVHPARTDADGRFTFDQLPPGRYVFGIGLTSEPHRIKPREYRPGIYLPGTLEVADARRIDIAAGDEVDLGVISFPN